MGSRFSRRKCMIFCQTLAGVACLLSMILIEFISDYAEVNFSILESFRILYFNFQIGRYISFVGKLAISASFGMWYLIIVEVFAIEVSMQLLGFSQILGRADPIAAPFIIKARDQQTLNNKSWSMTYRRYFIPSKAKTGLVTDDHIWIGFFGFSSLFLFSY